jgi:uncharacterized RDD family membrane protein YckC
MQPDTRSGTSEASRPTAYRTPRSTITFLVVVLVLGVIWVTLVLATSGPLALALQLLGVLLLVLYLAVIWLVAGWWTGKLGPVAARCPACGRGYPKAAGPFCSWDGTKLTQAK